MKTATRTYRMTARADAVSGTRERILDAAIALHLERFASDISLADVAAAAGVSVQTILRHFGSRDGLTSAARQRAQQEVERERRVQPGDVRAGMEALVDHYERRGDGVLTLLAQERTEAFAAEVTAGGRELHRRWVEETFAPQLAGRADPDALVDLLVVATDVYTWKLLRRDRGLSATTTRERMETLVHAVLAAPPG